MIRLTRRQALGCAIAGAIAPLILSSEANLQGLEIATVDPRGLEPGESIDDWSPVQLAGFIASWELLAQQQNRPSKWKRLHYTGALQWRLQSEGRLPLIAWYGIGTPDQVTSDLESFVEFLGGDHAPGSVDDRLQAIAVTQGGRSFAVVSVGQFSARARHTLARPAWRKLKFGQAPCP